VTDSGAANALVISSATTAAPITAVGRAETVVRCPVSRSILYGALHTRSLEDRLRSRRVSHLTYAAKKPHVFSALILVHHC
jgi:hypothetical protein